MKISSKIIKGLKNKNFNRIINLVEFNSVKGQLLEIETKLSKNFNEYQYDPSHKIYLYSQNLLSIFSEEFSVTKEFNEYYDIVVEMDNDFIPYGPPMSPLTASYFTFWCFCDFRFGSEKETIGTIFYDLAYENKFDELLLKSIQNLNKSYMGFYVHNGFDNDLIILKEIMTNKEFRCICPTGYKGSKGEIWYVRIAPNIDSIYNYHIILNTPYVIINYKEKDWISYFQRQSITKENIHYSEKLYQLLKYNSDNKYWHNYIMDAYVNSFYDRISLTGIPDLKGTKPHELN
jgi:hypothetical protein